MAWARPVDAGTRLVADAGGSISGIVDEVRKVTELIGTIANATAEQSAGIGRVNGALAERDRSTQQNAALVEQRAAAAGRLRDQVARLAHAVAGFERACAALRSTRRRRRRSRCSR